mmetsp:Transcript_94302/g.202443  ORF Transcript_94302/g.202443 Transcript_94302/m.202443 type:complete len:121 (+) Transcript_94302:653-1015(+)
MSGQSFKLGSARVKEKGSSARAPSLQEARRLREGVALSRACPASDEGPRQSHGGDALLVANSEKADASTLQTLCAAATSERAPPLLRWAAAAAVPAKARVAIGKARARKARMRRALQDEP